MEVLDSESIKLEPKTVYHIIFGNSYSFWKYALPIFVAGFAWRFSLVNSFLNRYLQATNFDWENVEHLYKSSWFVVTIDMISYPIFLAICVPLLVKWVKPGILILLLYIPLDIVHQWLATKMSASLEISILNALMLALTFAFLFQFVKKWKGNVLQALVVSYIAAEYLVFFVPAMAELYFLKNESAWDIIIYLVLDVAFLKFELVKVANGLAAGVAFIATRYVIQLNSPFNPSATTE